LITGTSKTIEFGPGFLLPQLKTKNREAKNAN
jgi:hypothetical protein